MPVRIIFRGLILFRFPQAPDPDAGKLVAQLVNKPKIPGRPTTPTTDRPPRGPHEHNHGAQMQIATDHGVKDERLPVELAVGERIDISVLDNGKPVADGRVTPEQSFRDHVPDLAELMRNASIPAVEEAARAPLQPNLGLIQNIITVDRGRVRVREVVTWDHGGFPLDGKRGQPPGSPDERGSRPASHAALKFVGSRLQGHVASEFVVDIWDANEVDLKSSVPGSKLARPAKANGKLSHRVPYDTVEILVTNYEVQEHTAVPWGLDFQWLLEAAGYASADLAADFAEFETFATTFDRAVFDHDREMLLERAPATGLRTVGRPFPYIAWPAGVRNLTPLSGKPLSSTDEEDRPICVGAVHR